MQTQVSRYASLTLALAVGTMLGACKGQRSGPAVSESAGGAVAAPTTSDTTGAAGATTGATGGSAVGTDTTKSQTTGADTTGASASSASAGGLSGLTDANYVALLDEANKADSTAGALAMTKANDAHVKAFAKRMMTDHHMLRREGEQLAKKLNVTPEPPANDPVQQLASQASSALESAQKGAGFDSTYIDQEVKVHQAVLDLVKTVESDAQNAQLKALAKKAQPVIQSHLMEAQTIQKRLTSAS
jgi:Predicted outer membrane protein